MYPASRPLILFGGGLDSCAMVEFNHSFNPVLMHFDYGQKALRGELHALLYYEKKYGLSAERIKLPSALVPASPLTSEEVVTDASKHSANYIPGRNLLFGAIAYSFACAHDLKPILLGASPAPADSAFRDAKAEFSRSFNQLVAETYPDTLPWLMLPLVSGVRKEYLARALLSEPDLFKIAYTCYEEPEGVHALECGKCVHCQQKQELAKQLNARMK